MSTEKELSEWVTLVSNDDFEFVILRSAACLAGTIRRSLDESYKFQEAQTGRVKLTDINGVVLEKVVEYLYYHQKYADSKDVPDMDIPPELCLELLYAADYLNV